MSKGMSENDSMLNDLKAIAKSRVSRRSVLAGAATTVSDLVRHWRAAQSLILSIACTEAAVSWVAWLPKQTFGLPTQAFANRAEVITTNQWQLR